MPKVSFDEGQNTEFKRKYGDKVLKTITAFSNTNDGVIYLGIKNDREVVGINITQKLTDGIQNACSNIQDPVTVEFEKKEFLGKEVLLIKVCKGDKIPYFLSGAAYVRQGAETRPATKEEVIKMATTHGYIQFEKQPVRNATLKDIDKNKIQYYIEERSKRSISDTDLGKLGKKEFLLNTGSVFEENGKLILTTSGLLFFGKNPQKFFPHSRISIARFKGTTRTEIIDSAEITGSIIEMIEEAVKFIIRNIRISSKIVGFERKDKLEYPREALREAITNSLAHREYILSSAPVQISIFDDRIEITNPGVPDVPFSELEGKHIPRNELICARLRDILFMERYGTGITRMKRFMKEHELEEPVFEKENEFFKVTFIGPGQESMGLAEPVVFDDSRYRKWLSDETKYIDVRGIGLDQKGMDMVFFPILELYTKLYTRITPGHLDLGKAAFQVGERVELIEMAEGTQHLAIVGNPGSGKTTFLRFLAKTQLDDPTGFLPIYLRLGEVYRFLVERKLHLRERYSPQVFLDFLVEDLSKKNDLRLTRTGLENRMKEGQCWFLLDSLDELPSTAEREKMIGAIEQASEIWESCRFVVTSRLLAMKGKCIPMDFKLVNIDEFQDEEIRSFLKTWTRILFPKASEKKRQQYWGGLLNIIRGRPEIHKLARNPVMLTSMALIHYNEKLLPEGRADLLEAVIWWLIRARRRPQEIRHMLGETAEEMYYKIKKIYQRIAFAMFDIDGERRDQVGTKWAAEEIAQYFDGDEKKALKFLRQEETETGILVRRGEGNVAFWHLLFQEYLAASEIAEKSDDEERGWWSIVRENLAKPEWREVICLVPPCLNRLGTEQVNLFLDRLINHYAITDLPTKAKGVALVGQVLKDLEIYGYKPTDFPVWHDILNDIQLIFELDGQEILIEDRYNAAVAYGEGGDLRLRSFEDTWISIPGGTFNMGAQAKDESKPNFDPDAKPWEGPVIKINFSGFQIRKYPVTVEEFRQFVSDEGYENRLFWTTESWQWKSENDIKEPRDWEAQLRIPNNPVSGVSWYEAEAYSRWLSENDQQGWTYRLPSEAEWEYTVRRNMRPGRRFPWGNKLNTKELAEANWLGCGLRKQSPVGIFPKSNIGKGITDMIGNVEEWCADSWSWDHKGYPRNGTVRTKPTENGCVVRGGSAIRVSILCRPTYRSRCNKESRYPTIGFRLVRCQKGTAMDRKFD